MPTLVLPPRYGLDTRILWKAAIQVGWEVERLASWHPPEWLKSTDIAIYGEPLFVAVVATSLGITLLKPPLDWITSLPANYSKRNVEFRSLADARSGPFPAFIKPADDKFFVAKVFKEASQLPSPDDSTESLPTLIAEPVQWGLECRCFVLDREVAAISAYSREGEVLQDEDGRWPNSTTECNDALAFARSMLGDSTIPIPEAVVIDVGHIAGRGWAVVEANPAWGSGIYGCDPASVLRVIHRACKP